MIETNIFNSESRVEQKINYNKGDYDALRTYIECDWNTEFAAINLEVEETWNIIQNKIDDGIKRFVPLTFRFNNPKWKKTLSGEIRNQIRRKKISGGIISEIKILLAGCNTQNREIK